MDLLTHALSGAAIGAAFSPDERSRVPLMIVGAAAALLPDLDALAGRASAAAAWRYHRVALHGVPMIPILAIPLIAATEIAARGAWIPAVPPLTLAWIVTLAIVAHLLLDTLTSFGTALLFPFSRRRFSTHSHFIVDIPVLALLAWGVIARRPSRALLLCGVEIAMAIAWRAWHAHGARQAIRNQPSGAIRRLLVEPGPLAPLRWSVMATFEDGSTRISRTFRPGALSPVEFVPSQAPATLGALERARVDPLVAAYLDTVDVPHVEWIGRDSEPVALIIEDLKWRVHRGVRPLRLMVPWRGDLPSGAAREMSMLGAAERPSQSAPIRRAELNRRDGKLLQDG